MRAVLATAVAVCLLLTTAGVQLPDRASGMQLSATTGGQQTGLTLRALDNLVAYTRLLGYVRYFHPSDASYSADWDAIAVRTIQSVENIPDAPTLAAKLQAIFAPFAPTLRVFVSGQAPPPLPAALIPPPRGDVSIVQWFYLAFGVRADIIPTTTRIVSMVHDGQIPAGFADPQQPYPADLGGGVSALIPLAVFADKDGTLPHVSPPIAESPGSYDPKDPAVWLADIAIAWNAVQHFYPYWDTLNVDWQASLRAAFIATAQATDPAGFYRALRTMFGLLNDGHAYTSSPYDPLQGANLPVNWDWIENRLIVVHVHGKESGRIRVGDEVTTVDGRPVIDIVNSPDNVTGGTEAFRRWVALRALLTGPFGSAVRLGMRSRNGTPYVVTLHRGQYSPGPPEPRPKSAVKRLAPGIIYVDLTRLTDSKLTRVLRQLVKAKGIVFDARGYPDFNTMVHLYGHLSTTPLSSGKLLTPIVTYPDHQRMAFRDDTYFLPVLRPRIKAKLVFLIDAEGTVSRAEHFLVTAEGFHLGQFVGSHTAGSNGELSGLSLPGTYTVSWTGVRALKVDGSQLMHIGILPTVSVDRTIRGVIAGRDELLQRGIKVLKQELRRVHLRTA